MRPTACTASVWVAQPCARARAKASCDGLDGAGLAVGELQATAACARDRAGSASAAATASTFDAAVGIDGQLGDVGSRMSGAGASTDACSWAATMRLRPSAGHHPGIGLGRAAGEDHLGGRRADERRDLLACGLDDAAGTAALGMHGGRVAVLVDTGQHGGARLRAQRRRGVVIEVCAGGVRHSALVTCGPAPDGAGKACR